MAILKFEVWHPVAKHGSGKQEEIHITKKEFAASFCFLFLHSKVLFRSAQPYFVTGWQTVPFKIAASGAKCALLAMTNLIGFAGKRDSFWNEKVSITAEFHCAALPCLVPGCRLVPSKIAASGIENALLAMTESVGFSKKRDSFQIEMFEKRCSATPCKKTAYNNKRPFSKQNRPNFVSLRGAQRRGNLKAKGMAFLGEARCPRETDFKHFGNKNGRFYCKTYHFCVIARPQRGRGNL